MGVRVVNISAAERVAVFEAIQCVVESSDQRTGFIRKLRISNSMIRMSLDKSECAPNPAVILDPECFVIGWNQLRRLETFSRQVFLLSPQCQS